MTALLDVNILIALIDPSHVAHPRVHAWFSAEGKRDVATCPLTENGLVRIFGSPRYGAATDTPVRVMEFLVALRQQAGCSFWPDDISLVDHGAVETGKILTSGQVTDTYLLALAVSRRGKLATLDRRLVTSAVIGGKSAMLLVE